ncbi:MAG: AmmeMemoRadiSam system protein A [Anaerolineaceae bacterium]|jgi:AmmeMemoRadiSam system protein A|nr:AmmeMemoRadiSam system protein A [Anaerolineaceae bacterium]
MNINLLNDTERKQLLALARQCVELAAAGQPLPDLNLAAYPPVFQADGASFVTLTKHGSLRGCIGTLTAYQPLVQDVCEHAAAAAVEDYRFPKVQPEEVGQLHIEISRLTLPEPLVYDDPAQLPGLLHPGVDGVVLRDGARRATFLPQVWEQLPDAEAFLSHLSSKMGASSDLWRKKKLDVEIYHVEEFGE